jgi:PAS domain S-box-containing protein
MAQYADARSSGANPRGAGAIDARGDDAPPAHWQRLSLRASRLACSLCGLIALLVLAGWVTGSVVLTSVSPAWPAMVPNTAAALLLASIAAWLLAGKGRSRVLLRAGQIAASLATAIGLGTVLEYGRGSLGLDQLLFRIPESFMFHPGRPALPTAVAIVAAGVALLLLRVDSRRSIQPSDYAVGVAGVVGLAGLASYIYGAVPVYGIPGKPPSPAMALPTATALVLLSFSIVMARPAAGLIAVVLSGYLGGAVARRMLLVASVFPAFGILVVGGYKTGAYGVEFAASVLTTGGLCLGILMLVTIGLKLNQLDKARIQAAFQQVRLASIVESSSDAIISATPEGVGLTWNRAAERIYGYSASEVLNNRELAMKVVPPERRGEIGPLLERLGRGERVEGFETERLRKNGERFHVSLTLSPMLGEDGKVLGISTIVRDITPRVRAEQALQQAHMTEQRLRKQVEAVSRASMVASEAVVDLPKQSLEHTLEVIVEQTRSLTGASYAALGVGGNEDTPFNTWVFTGMAPEQAAQISRLPRPIGLLGAAARANAPIRAPDLRVHEGFLGFPPGHPPMQAFLGQPIRYQGDVIGTLYLAKPPGEPPFTAEDAVTVAMLAERAAIAIHTARLYDEAALKRAWLQSVIDQLPEGVIVLDATGAVAAMNAAALALTSAGTGDSDPWGNPHRFDVRSSSGEPVPFHELPLVRAFVHQESIHHQEFQLRPASGAPVPILASAVPVRGESDKLLGAALIMQDITLLKELERQREEWISVIAHDLRQPVGVIRFSADLLARSALPEKAGSLLERVRNATTRLETMINDLLDASRLEAHRLALEKQQEDLPALVDRILEHLDPVKSGHHVSVTCQGALRPVLVDPGRIEQVLGNLLSNAAKYGEPTTEIQITLEDRGDEALVSVINRGPVIPDNELGKLFNRFQRSRKSKHSGVKGIGLGLYICKGLVEAHGGRVGADSAGELTRFHFTLPYAPAPALAQELGSARCGRALPGSGPV